MTKRGSDFWAAYINLGGWNKQELEPQMAAKDGR
jgi:hypothetical protein